MQNKPKTRTDVQWVIASISIAVTLGLWSIFASHDRTGAGVVGQVLVPPQPDQVAQLGVTQSPALLPGQKLLFGGTAPQLRQVIVTRTRARGGGSGGGGGGGGGAAHTGSSKP